MVNNTNFRPCTPKDMISFSLPYNLSAKPQRDDDLSFNGCLPFCHQTEYVAKISPSPIDPDAIKHHINFTESKALADAE